MSKFILCIPGRGVDCGLVINMDRIAVKSNVKRDSDGFEDIDDFWESTEPGKCSVHLQPFLCSI